MLRINFVRVVSSLLVIFGSLKKGFAYTYDVAVTQFLHENGFGHFESLFSENDVTFDLLQDITEFDLQAIGIRSWGVRKKISLAINDLQPSKRARALAEKPSANSEKGKSGDSEKLPLEKPEKPKLDDFTGIRIDKDDAIIQMGKKRDVSLYRSGTKTANFEGSLRLPNGVLQFGSSLTKCDAAAAGSVTFNPTSKKLILCDGKAWSPIGAVKGGSPDGPVPSTPTYMVGNNGYWRADKGVALDKDGKTILRWKGEAFDLDPPSGLAPVLALPGSSRNSHPKYPAIDFQGKGTALVSTKMHPSGCGDSWTYFVVVKPLVEIGWRNIFTTYDAPANSVNKACVEGGCTSADPYKYEPWSITEIGVHGWHSPDWHPGKLRMNQLQVVVYSTEKTKGLTINYYENGQAPREYTKTDFNQVCNRKGGSNRGYVAMGRGVQNPSHNYNGLIYEAITFPRFMSTSEIRMIANKLLDKYAMPVPDYAKTNNGYWRADQGVSLSGSSVTRWSGAALDLVPPSGLAPVLALPKSARNSHPKYPAIDFQGKGTALVSLSQHASGCGDSWTYFVVVKPLVEIGWRNIFTTYDAPANSVNKACVEGGCTSADPYKYEPWSITEIGVHGWHSPDWHPGKLRMNQLQVVVYSTEKTKGLTINYYENGQAPREYTKKDFNQVCNRKGGSNRGYVAMGRGVQNPSHNYNGLIYEAITFPRFMSTGEIRAIANKLLGKYA